MLAARRTLLGSALAAIVTLPPRAWSEPPDRASAISETLSRVPVFVVTNSEGEPYLTEVDSVGRRWGSVFLSPRDSNELLMEVRKFDSKAVLAVVPLSTVYSEVAKSATDLERQLAAVPQPRRSTTNDLRLLRLLPLLDERPPQDVGELPTASSVPLYYEPSLVVDVETEQRRPYFFRYEDLRSTWVRAGVPDTAPSIRVITIEKLLRDITVSDAPSAGTGTGATARPLRPLLLPASDTADVMPSLARAAAAR